MHALLALPLLAACSGDDDSTVDRKPDSGVTSAGGAFDAQTGQPGHDAAVSSGSGGTPSNLGSSGQMDASMPGHDGGASGHDAGDSGAADAAHDASGADAAD